MPSGMDLGGSLLVSCDRPSNNNKNKPIQMIDSQANHYITSYITHSSWFLPLFLIRKLYKFVKEWNWSFSFVSIKNNPSSPFSFLYLKHHTYNEGGKGFFRDPWKAFFPVKYQMAIFFFSWNVIWLHTREPWIDLFSRALQNDCCFSLVKCYCKPWNVI